MKPLAFLLLIAMFPLLYSVSGILSAVSSAINSLCEGLTSLLPVAAMLMTIIAGVIYASGQVMGAETRARANVWATACMTGALMAVLIAVVTPAVLGTIYYGSTITCTGASGMSAGGSS
jgi:hypothetical protein